MSSNQSAKRKLEMIFGKICMIEASGIRYVPINKRKKIKGYKKCDDEITYHHIKERVKGGQSTVENGALIKGYNHRWLHSLPEDEKQKVNQLLMQFKAEIMQGMEGISVDRMPQETNPDSEYSLIDTSKSSKKKRFNRAKEKKDFKRRIDYYYQGKDEDDDWER